MKPKFTLFVFLFLFLNSFQLDAGSVCFLQSDPLNGPKKEYYSNGKLMREYTLKDGKIEGSYRSYDELGRLISDQYCKDGVPDGSLKTFYPGGQLRSEGIVRPNGDITGPSNEYYESGTIKRESIISGQFPKLSSQTTIYYENGNVHNKITFSQGEFESSVSYDEQGRITSEQSRGRSVSYWYDKDGTQHVSIDGVEQGSPK